MPVRRPPRLELARLAGVTRLASVLGATGAGLVVGLSGAGPALALGLPTPAPLPIPLPTALPQPVSPSPTATPTPPPVADPVATLISKLGTPTPTPAPGSAPARRPSGTSTKAAPKPAPRPTAKGAAPVGVRSTPGPGGTGPGGAAAPGALPTGLSGNPLLATGSFPAQLSSPATLGDLLSPMLAGPAPDQATAPDLAAPLVGVASAVAGVHRGSTDPARPTTVVVIAFVTLASVAGAHLVRFRRDRAGSPAGPAAP